MEWWSVNPGHHSYYFMLRTIEAADKNIWADPPRIITLTSTAQDIIPDQLTSTDEIALRIIQNVGGTNSMNFCYGDTCDNNLNFHGQLAANSAPLVLRGCQRVSAMSPSGTTVAITIFKRRGL